MLQDALCRPVFARNPILQDQDVVTHVRNDRQIMRDEQQRGVVFANKSVDQHQNRPLNCDIQGRCWLVANEKLRVIRKRHRDENSLALAPGELKRIRIISALGEPHRLKKLTDFSLTLPSAVTRRTAVPASTLVLSGAGPTCAFDLFAHGHERIQRGHRLLENHRHAHASELAEGAISSAHNFVASEHDRSGRAHIVGQKPHDRQCR